MKHALADELWAAVRHRREEPAAHLKPVPARPDCAPGRPGRKRRLTPNAAGPPSTAAPAGFVARTEAEAALLQLMTAVRLSRLGCESERVWRLGPLPLCATAGGRPWTGGGTSADLGKVAHARGMLSISH